MVTDEIKKLRKGKSYHEFFSFIYFVITASLFFAGVFLMYAAVTFHELNMYTLFIGILDCFGIAGSFMHGMRQFRKLLAIEDQLEKLEKVAAEVEQRPRPVNG